MNTKRLSVHQRAHLHPDWPPAVATARIALRFNIRAPVFFKIEGFFLFMICLPAIMRQRLAPSALMLVAVLLFAQWLGLAHRIEHGRLTQAQQVQGSLPVLQGDSAGYDKALEHNCALFDGAALASALHSPAVSLAIVPGAKILALWIAFASWDAPVLLHFSSRAPPRA